MEKGQSLQQMVLGKLDSHMQKNTSGPLPYTIYKNQCKMSIRLETIKLVNIDDKCLDISFDDIFSGIDTKRNDNKTKNR